jgi:hypothetical protein
VPGDSSHIYVLTYRYEVDAFGRLQRFARDNQFTVIQTCDDATS